MITAQKTPKYIRLRCFRTEYVELTTARVQFRFDSLPSLTPIKSKVQLVEIFLFFALDFLIFLRRLYNRQAQAQKEFERFL